MNLHLLCSEMVQLSEGLQWRLQVLVPTPVGVERVRAVVSHKPQPSLMLWKISLLSASDLVKRSHTHSRF